MVAAPAPALVITRVYPIFSQIYQVVRLASLRIEISAKGTRGSGQSASLGVMLDQFTTQTWSPVAYIPALTYKGGIDHPVQGVLIDQFAAQVPFA